MVAGAVICSVLLVSFLGSVWSSTKAPEITDPIARKTEYVKSGKDHTLLCQATGNPAPEYRWTLNSEYITSDAIQISSTTGSLNITSFTRNEEGNYQCFAENMVGTGKKAVAMSEVITVKMVDLSNDEWNAAVRSPSKLEYSYLKMTCNDAPASVPEGQFNWYFAEGDTTQGDISQDKRIYMDTEGSLHFTYLLQTDETSGGLMYKCSVYNAPLDTIRLGSPWTLSVNPNSATQIAPVWQSGTRAHAQFLLKKDAVLECVFSGSPVPEITWKDNMGNVVNITEDGPYQTIKDSFNRALVVKNLREQQEGTWTCKGTTSSSAEHSFFLDVISGPIWVEGLASQTVPRNKDAVFKCKSRKAVGDVEEINQPVWYINSGVLPIENTGKYEFSEGATVLTIRNVQQTDINCFQCNVSNSIGYEFGDGCLNVIEPIMYNVTPPAVQEVTKGDIVNLTVIGYTDPAYTLQYRWVFNNTKYPQDNGLQHPPFVTYNETSMEAYINTSELTDQQYWAINGTYDRILYHTDDSSVYTISVIVNELPEAAAVVAAGLDLWWIALIVALIILIIVIILIVVICNRKRQEGTYPLDKKERNNDIDPEKDLADSGFQDLSRAPGDDDYPTKKQGLNPNFDYGDDRDSDDADSLMEYGGGDFDTSKFNEDGSFIGQYTSKNKTPEVKQSPMALNHQSTESQI